MKGAREMKEVKLVLETLDNCERITVFEDGVACQSTIYHKGTDPNTMVLLTVQDWYGTDEE